MKNKFREQKATLPSPKNKKVVVVLQSVQSGRKGVVNIFKEAKLNKPNSSP